MFQGKKINKVHGKAGWIIAAGIVLMLLTILISLVMGLYPIPFSILSQLVLDAVQGRAPNETLSTHALVLWSVRLPRVLMAVLVGAALSVAGAVFQGLFRNPLVSPGILGVSAGAAFGAALAIVFASNMVTVEISAFFWALAAVGLAYLIGHRGPQSVTTLVLAGVIVSALFMAGLSLLKYKADPYDQLPAIVFWTMGSLNNIVWKDVIKASVIIFTGISALYVFRWQLNVMALGDESASALGINVFLTRSVYILISTLIVAASISSCGDIRWMGLVIPHMARMIIGPDHDVLIPFSAILGGTFMLAMDTVTRNLPGGEIPVGILTAFLGAPFLAYLLIKEKKNAWQN
ncbi:MAG: iron ABC transporter permease [bacterium]|nr:iron ABC transporter permease [bacterium]